MALGAIFWPEILKIFWRRLTESRFVKLNIEQNTIHRINFLPNKLLNEFKICQIIHKNLKSNENISRPENWLTILPKITKLSIYL